MCNTKYNYIYKYKYLRQPYHERETRRRKTLSLAYSTCSFDNRRRAGSGKWEEWMGFCNHCALSMVIEGWYQVATLKSHKLFPNEATVQSHFFCRGRTYLRAIYDQNNNVFFKVKVMRSIDMRNKFGKCQWRSSMEISL